MTISEPSSDDADYRGQVLERYAARSRSFANQVTILMVFAIAFLVFVVFPLAALNFDTDHLDLQEAETRALSARSEALASNRSTLANEIDTLRGKITSLNYVLESKRQEAEARAGERAALEKSSRQTREIVSSSRNRRTS